MYPIGILVRPVTSHSVLTELRRATNMNVGDVLERTTIAEDGEGERSVLPVAMRPRRTKLGLALAAGGLVTVLLAATGLARGPSHRPVGAVPSSALSSARTGELTVAVADMHVARVTYDPGQASSWHEHAGVHVVAILSGTLTIYDATCQPHLYGPGDSYIGGLEMHLARNNTADPVEMIVTYLPAAGTAPEAFVVPMPAPACTLP
jgi:quercetin dioxygenase-like cupin family protein